VFMESLEDGTYMGHASQRRKDAIQGDATWGGLGVHSCECWDALSVNTVRDRAASARANRAFQVVLRACLPEDGCQLSRLHPVASMDPLCSLFSKTLESTHTQLCPSFRAAA
jgi:hypothetical protein